MTKADINAIVTGTHADPFAILGPHEVAGGLAIRVFRPHARQVELVVSTTQDRLDLKKIHAAGLFEIVVPAATREGFDYRVRVQWNDGATSELDDPYRYGPVLTSFDLHLLGEGTHFQAFEKLGARRITHGIRQGVHFAVWAPNAKRVSVAGNFNGWDGRVHPMRALAPGGYWEIFIPDLGGGDPYKFEIIGAHGEMLLKSDPCGRFFETPPKTASIVWDSPGYAWRDETWMADRPKQEQWKRRPMAIYEVHLGSWRRPPDGRLLTYREMAQQLVPYVKDMGFTHIELLPVMVSAIAGAAGLILRTPHEPRQGETAFASVRPASARRCRPRLGRPDAPTPVACHRWPGSNGGRP
jgi:1,4-alpha-glucan branching enzyme